MTSIMADNSKLYYELNQTVAPFAASELDVVS